MAVAPPSGDQTDKRPRGNPPDGSARSSCEMPDATCSAVRCVTGVASGKRCSRIERREERAAAVAGIQDIPTSGPARPTSSGEGGRKYPEQRPKARMKPLAEIATTTTPEPNP